MHNYFSTSAQNQSRERRNFYVVKLWTGHLPTHPTELLPATRTFAIQCCSCQTGPPTQKCIRSGRTWVLVSIQHAKPHNIKAMLGAHGCHCSTFWIPLLVAAFGPFWLTNPIPGTFQAGHTASIAQPAWRPKLRFTRVSVDSWP